MQFYFYIIDFSSLIFRKCLLRKLIYTYYFITSESMYKPPNILFFNLNYNNML